jgi:hypothetical protein
VRVAVTWLFLACASASTQTGTGREQRNLLTQEQLSATNTVTLYEAIEKLRPEWLTSRGPASVTDATPTVPSVFMNGTMLGKAEYLREMRVVDVTEVRYWEPGPASARFGMGHPRGVIELSRR